MLLPNNGVAVIELAKLTEYCLNEYHPVGKHKAILFKRLLGFTIDDAEYMRNIIFNAITKTDAVFEREDKYGKRYIVDFSLNGIYKNVTIRTAWIYLVGESFPRLITCYIKD